MLVLAVHVHVTLLVILQQNQTITPTNRSQIHYSTKKTTVYHTTHTRARGRVIRTECEYLYEHFARCDLSSSLLLLLLAR